MYWCATGSLAEAHYLVGILNSEATMGFVSALQSKGQFGRRDIDKAVFAAPFPIYDPEDEIHRGIAQVASEAVGVAGNLAFPAGTQFQRARKTVRETLRAAGIDVRLNHLVQGLLGAGS